MPPPQGAARESRGPRRQRTRTRSRGTPRTRRRRRRRRKRNRIPRPPRTAPCPRFVPRFNFTPKDLTRFVDFNIKGRDVIVFLHIQKTGGTTFGRHLVKNIRLEQPCSCKAGQKSAPATGPARRRRGSSPASPPAGAAGCTPTGRSSPTVCRPSWRRKTVPATTATPGYCPPAASSRFRPPSFPLQPYPAAATAVPTTPSPGHDPALPRRRGAGGSLVSSRDAGRGFGRGRRSLWKVSWC